MGDPQYFLNIHVGGHFECKPNLTYIGGEVFRVKDDPDTISYFELDKIVKKGLLYNSIYSIRYKVPNSDVLEGNLKVVWNDETTIEMLNLWYEVKEINLYVEHECEVPLVVDGALSQEDFERIHGPLNQEGSKKVVENDEVEVGDEEGLEDIEVGDVEVEGENDENSQAGPSEPRREGKQPVIASDHDSEHCEVDEEVYENFHYMSDGEFDEELFFARKKSKVKKSLKVPSIQEDPELSMGVQPTRVEAEVVKDKEIDEDYFYDSDDHCDVVDDEDDGFRRKGKFSLFNFRSEKISFVKGMVFKDKEQFKVAIKKYSVQIRRELKFKRNMGTRFKVICVASKQCQWFISVAFRPNVRGLQVIKMNEEHNCTVSFTNKMASTKLIAQAFEETIVDHPKMKIKEIKSRTASQMNVNVPWSRIRKAKVMVRDKLTGNYIKEFSQLRDYAEECRQKNPGSTIKMSTTRENEESQPHFKSIYFCFAALKNGWKAGCRPILGVDGCFLKGPFKAELLAAVGRDGNNQMFPVAWAIVDGETTETWTWFLTLLSMDLELGDGQGFTIISGHNMKSCKRPKNQQLESVTAQGSSVDMPTHTKSTASSRGKSVAKPPTPIVRSASQATTSRPPRPLVRSASQPTSLPPRPTIAPKRPIRLTNKGLDMNVNTTTGRTTYHNGTAARTDAGNLQSSVPAKKKKRSSTSEICTQESAVTKKKTI